ncbi:hypothetical protein GYB61_09620 [bacterium]|nr:hypothetical protein [bacterium]
MKRTNMTLRGKLLAGLTALFVLGASAPAVAQQQSLDELLKETRQARDAEKRASERRVAEFRRERNRQAALLREAKAELAALERRTAALTKKYDENDARLSELETTLSVRSAALGAELFGVVRQIAGDMFSAAQNSMVSAQLGEDRIEFLSTMAEAKALPSIEQLERLWYEMQREMTEIGRVTTFTAPVIEGDGQQTQKPVTRVGSFTAFGDGEFLTYQDGKFGKLSKQPASRYVSTAKEFVSESSGYHTMVVDPSSGGLLYAKTQERGLIERVFIDNEGREVGWIIIALTVIGLLIAALKFMGLMATSAKIASQRKNMDNPKDTNPLGRVVQAYYKDPSADTETLELRMDEAVLKETPAIERWLGAIKILAAVGPLLGLLGTVTGMIQVFQSITLYGTGDPKLMAGGISQALITTVLGLVMAIPLVLIHALLSARAKAIVQTLDEESVGLIAEHREAGGTPAGA